MKFKESIEMCPWYSAGSMKDPEFTVTVVRVHQFGPVGVWQSFGKVVIEYGDSTSRIMSTAANV